MTAKKSGSKGYLWKRVSASTTALISAVVLQSGAAWAADHDGDGYDELVIGASGDAPAALWPRSGVAYVLRGTAQGPAAQQLLSQVELTSGDEGDGFGKAFAPGDFNADGYMDLAVGVPGKDFGSSLDAGAVMVFLGSPGGLVEHQLLEQSVLGLNEPGDRFGAALAAGDFDGDGHADLAVGAPQKALSAGARSGAAVLFRGTPNGLSAYRYLGQAGMGGDSSGDLFGAALSAGDFNGDGYADLAVGAPGEAIGSGPKSGVLFVFHGSATSLSAHRYLDQTGMSQNETGDDFGRTLTAGDFNGDGYADLAVGAPGEVVGSSARSGVVFLFRGAASGLAAHRCLDQTGMGDNSSGDLFGAALSAGDFNGDGYADLAVGAPGEAIGSGPKSGVVFLFRGAASGPVAHAYVSQSGMEVNEAGDNFGRAVSFGDFNGDGYADLAVGAPGEVIGSGPKSGGVFLFHGSASGPTADRLWDQAGLGLNEEGDSFGGALP